ncbi:MAG TPA: hypothetical protein ENK02_09380 [Planctomycetes bacterium]|nr:hypothetical protein [Planctomycetota bacterium]
MHSILISSLCFLCTSLAGTSLLAQSNTIPKGWDQKEGNSESWAGFRFAPARVQSFIKLASLPFTSKTIRGLKIRRDGLRTTRFQAHSNPISITLSAKAAPETFRFPSAVSFDRNLGQDQSLVLTKKNIHFPRLALPRTPPAPFSVDLPFAKPFTLNKPTGLIIDIKVYATATQNSYWMADAQGQRIFTSPFGRRQSLGVGCPRDFYSYSTMVYPGSGPLQTYGFSRTTKVRIGMVWFGSSTTQWGSTKLPYQIPSTTCSVYNDAFIVKATLTDPKHAGRMEVDWGTFLPWERIAGLKFPFQMAVWDPGFNRVEFRLSRGNILTVGNGFPKTVETFELYNYQSSFRKVDPDTAKPYFYRYASTIFQAY